MNKISAAIPSIAFIVSLTVLIFVWKISSEIKVLSAQIAQTNTASGNAISNKISSEVEKNLSTIESQLDDESKCPTTPNVPADWYKDPSGRFELRYWNGTAWTEHVATGGTQSTDAPR